MAVIEQPFLPKRLQFIKRVSGVTLKEARERMAAYLEQPPTEYPVERWYTNESTGPAKLKEAQALAHAFGVHVGFFYYKGVSVTLLPSNNLLVHIHETGVKFTIYFVNDGEL